MRVTARVVTTTPEEARQYVVQPGPGTGYHPRFQFRLWGDDPVSDDLIAGPGEQRPHLRAPNELRATWDLRISAYRLNEDPGPLDGDEIYAGVRLIDASGKTVKATESNRVRTQ